MQTYRHICPSRILHSHARAYTTRSRANMECLTFTPWLAKYISCLYMLPLELVKSLFTVTMLKFTKECYS